MLGRGKAEGGSQKCLVIILSRDKLQYMDLVAWNMTVTLFCYGMELALLTSVYFGLWPL